MEQAFCIFSFLSPICIFFVISWESCREIFLKPLSIFSFPLKFSTFKRKNALYFETTKNEIYNRQVTAIRKLQSTIKRAKEQLSKYLDCSKLLARYTYLFELKNYLASSHYTKKNLTIVFTFPFFWITFQRQHHILLPRCPLPQ